MLGGVQRDPATGRVVSAKATQFQLVGKMNGTAAKLEGVDIDNALGEWVSQLKTILLHQCQLGNSHFGPYFPFLVSFIVNYNYKKIETVFSIFLFAQYI